MFRQTFGLTAGWRNDIDSCRLRKALCGFGHATKGAFFERRIRLGRTENSLSLLKVQVLPERLLELLFIEHDGLAEVKTLDRLFEFGRILERHGLIWGAANHPQDQKKYNT
ncbi:MAG: hypothetical protein PHW95_03310 [Patescibacteria group bacterium]|nr:hypothetical protein [Patescibacteria group bacterium]